MLPKMPDKDRHSALHTKQLSKQHPHTVLAYDGDASGLRELCEAQNSRYSWLRERARRRVMWVMVMVIMSMPL